MGLYEVGLKMTYNGSYGRVSKVFQEWPPKGIATEKYTFSSASLVCLLRCTANKKQHLKTSTGAGDGGRASLLEPAIEPTPSSLPYSQPTPSRAFLSCVRNFKWCADGTLGLPHEAAVLSGTVRETTSHVAEVSDEIGSQIF